MEADEMLVRPGHQGSEALHEFQWRQSRKVSGLRTAPASGFLPSASQAPRVISCVITVNASRCHERTPWAPKAVLPIVRRTGKKNWRRQIPGQLLWSAALVTTRRLLFQGTWRDALGHWLRHESGARRHSCIIRNLKDKALVATVPASWKRRQQRREPSRIDIQVDCGNRAYGATRLHL